MGKAARGRDLQALLLCALLSFHATTLTFASAGMCGCEYRMPMLMDFFRASGGIEGNWLNTSGWGSTANCNTSWRGVVCEDGDIVAIELDNSGITGALPTSFGALTNLLRLSLSGNDFTGSIPDAAWSTMTKLDSIYLNQNHLVGTLPQSWGTSMGRLVALVLHTNSISGTLPAAWSALTRIQTLQLHTNSLDGTLPEEWSTMTDLRTLNLGGNGLTGMVPNRWPRSMPNVTSIHFDRNRLTGSLSEDWGTMRFLVALSLDRNQFSGTLPRSWSSLAATISQIDLSVNRLEGSLPEEWGVLNKLQTLYLSENSLSGTLPETWMGMRGLEHLLLHQNQLSGTLPEQWGSLTKLVFLSFFKNNISGPLPSSWSAMTKLIIFKAYENQLSGTLPSSWSVFAELEDFNLGENSLEGTLPREWSSMGALELLSVSNNRISGTLPASWMSMTALKHLSLHGNRLTGPLPASWRAMTKLQGMSLYSNNLTGTLPGVWFDSMQRLDRFAIGDNHLEGPIPAEIFSVPTLLILFLSFNQLSGPLPPRPAGGSAQRLYFFSIQNNSGIEPGGPLPQFQLAAFASYCGTGICRGAMASPIQFCLPDAATAVTIMRQTEADLSGIVPALAPFSYICTSPPPAPSSVAPSKAPFPNATIAQAWSSYNVLRDQRAAASVLVVTSLWSAGGLGRGAVPTLQRAARSASLAVYCTDTSNDDGSDPVDADNIFGLRISVESVSLDGSAGAAIGNAIALISCACLLHGLLWVRARIQHPKLRHAMKALPSATLPTAIALPYGMLALPSVSACVLLLASSYRTVKSGCTGGLMLLLWLGIPLYFVYAIVWRGRQLGGGSFPLSTRMTTGGRMPPVSTPQHCVDGLPPAVRSWLYVSRARVMQPREIWGSPVMGLSKGERNDAEKLLARFEPVFGGYVREREWFFAVEWVLALISGIVSGLAEALAASESVSSEKACTAARWGMGIFIALSVVQIAAYILLRPLSIRFEFLAAVLMGMLSVLIEILALIGEVRAAIILTIFGTSLEMLAMLLGLLYNNLISKPVNSLSSSSGDRLITGPPATPPAAHSQRSRLKHQTRKKPAEPEKPAARSMTSMSLSPRSGRKFTANRLVMEPSADEALSRLVQLICRRAKSERGRLYKDGDDPMRKHQKTKF